jgi:hypothetical protein
MKRRRLRGFDLKQISRVPPSDRLTDRLGRHESAGFANNGYGGARGDGGATGTSLRWGFGCCHGAGQL